MPNGIPESVQVGQLCKQRGGDQRWLHLLVAREDQVGEHAEHEHARCSAHSTPDQRRETRNEPQAFSRVIVFERTVPPHQLDAYAAPSEIVPLPKILKHALNAWAGTDSGQTVEIGLGDCARWNVASVQRTPFRAIADVNIPPLRDLPTIATYVLRQHFNTAVDVLPHFFLVAPRSMNIDPLCVI